MLVLITFTPKADRTGVHLEAERDSRSYVQSSVFVWSAPEVQWIKTSQDLPYTPGFDLERKNGFV
jgi:hypothetical protein